MIAQLSGKIKFKKGNFLILDVGGVGYKVFVATPLFFETQVEEEVEFFIHQHVHEDQIALYGFKTFEDLEFFEMLISISGIGPKAGLNILSKATVSEVKKAILQGDLSVFKAVVGIGPKKASHIIVELKSKIEDVKSKDATFLPSESNEAEEALLSLGYKTSEIREVLKDLPSELKTSEAKVKWALSKL